MTKATESKLAGLHGAVATVLLKQVEHTTLETTINELGEFVETGEVVHDASPATIAAAIKFLKDNNITCDVEKNEDMQKLAQVLAKKQKHSRLTGSAAALSLVIEE